MTYTGTNTYLLGLRDIAVIDPGPDHDAHFAAILAAIGPSQKITKILVTHSHLDHAPLARRLSAHCGAPVYAYGDSGAGRRPQMIALSEAGSIGGGEGVDYDFQPDITLEDGAVLDHEGQELIAIWTPGHFGNHMAFSWNGVVFSGDHVMGWASTMISPPDGDLGAFRRSCSKLQLRSERLYLPGHGDAIEDGPARLNWLLAHRSERESQIISHLQGQPNTAQGLAEAIYTDIDPRLIHAATRNVLAHLIDLCERKLATCHGPIDLQAKYSVI
jgi:glyoxylase-like metal-dependent hydrolase (beta-lactamase superfamily II)